MFLSSQTTKRGGRGLSRKLFFGVTEKKKKRRALRGIRNATKYIKTKKVIIAYFSLFC